MKRNNKKKMTAMYRLAVAGMLATALFLSTFSTAYGGELTVPHLFESGAPAVAAEVNDNFSAVEDEVSDNAARIDTNAAAIDDNSAAINTNTSDIGANTDAADANTDAISGHTAAIAALSGHTATAFGHVNIYDMEHISGSSNVRSVVWNAIYERFEIEVEGIKFTTTPNNFVAMATVSIAGTPKFHSFTAIDGKLCITIYNTSSNRIQSSFRWVVFTY